MASNVHDENGVGKFNNEEMPLVHKVAVPPKDNIVKEIAVAVRETFLYDAPLDKFNGRSKREKGLLGLKFVFPILEWITTYTPKMFGGHLIAGLTIASLAIPQDLAYAKLAGVPPINGLYSSFVPPLIYAVLGSSRDIAIGPVDVVSLLLGTLLKQESKLLVSMAPINYASLFTKLKADLLVSDPETKKRRCTSTSSFYPTEAQNRLLDVCGYKDFMNPPAFDTIKEVNAFVTKYADNKKAFKDKYGAEPCPGHVKILLDLFQIDYADDVDHLTAWKAKAMLKTVVPGDLGTHQMFRFFHEYHITDTAAWSDLSFKQATTLLEALNFEREAAAGLEAPAPNPVLPNTTVGVTNVASTSRPKNGKCAASTSTQ